MHGSIVTLDEHLGNACSHTEVTIYLERRMGVEQIGIGTTIGYLLGHLVVGQQMKHVGDNLEGMVAIEHACPEIGFPPQAPSCGHVASLQQGVAGSGKELRMLVGRYLIGGIESIEMRDVAVLVLGVVGILEPLLQLSVTAYLHGRKGSQRFFVFEGVKLENPANVVGLRSLGTARDMRLVQPHMVEHTGGHDELAEHIEDDLIVHRRTGSHCGFLSLRSMLGRDGGNGDEPSVARVLLHIVEQEVGSTPHDMEPPLQELYIACEKIMLPNMRGEPCATRGEHTPGGSVDGSGNAPQVGIMMCHPPIASI